jgi:putative isomerase
VWDFTKPPIHGWALGWMLDRGLKLSDSQAAAAYEALAALTEWWLRCRDYDGDGRPEYYHGNDSGWDNATVFRDGGPIESPDLLAFLVLQMETLAVLAGRLLKRDDAKTWRTRAKKLLDRLINDYWRDGQFIAYGPGHVEIRDSKSLFLHLPLVLGKRLPLEVRYQMVKNLVSSGLITRHGLATEVPGTALYENDGYWRGPIWAPPTLLITDGLWDMGEKKLAKSIAQKFCRLCAKSGFAENFDAQSGAGLRDRSYTWTASVFLILARNYLPPAKAGKAVLK